MKKKFLRPLTKHVSRLKVLYFFILVIIFTSIILFYIKTNDLDNYMNSFLTSKTEGTLDEHSSFLNMLLTKVKRLQGKEKSKNKKENGEKIKSVLMKIKGDLEKVSSKEISGLPPSRNHPKNLNIEKMNHDELINYLKPEKARNLSLKELNLIAQPVLHNDITFYNLHSKESEEPLKPLKSFVFLPSPLVSQNEKNELGLPVNLKQEIVFSKIAEESLDQILNAVGKDAKQAYFVSFSGFVRICKQDSQGGKEENLVDLYKDEFKYTKSFSATTYCKLTLRNEERPRESNLYIDVAGLGIVRTYTVAIINKKLGIIGLVGVDVDVQPIKRFLEEVNFSSHGLGLKNYQIDFSGKLLKEKKPGSIIIDNPRKLLEPDEISEISKFCEKNPRKLVVEVKRFSFKNEDRVIYTIPTGDNNVAFVIFDKEKMRANKFYFVAIILLMLIIVTILIYFVSKQHIKRIKSVEQQLHLISHMHGAYVITDPDNMILDYNEEILRLVEDDDLEGKNFNDYLTEDSVKDFEFYLNKGQERFECTLNIKTKNGISKPVIVVNTKTDPQLSKLGRISILIESENFESAVAEKYADRISHLLKTPLHSILGIADQLRRKTAKPRYDEYYRLLDSEIEGLKNEVSKLLKISRIEIKKLEPEFEKLDLTKLINTIKKEFEPVIRRKKLEFEINIANGVTIWADRNMVKASIENILENAFKYTIIGKISLYLSDSRENAEIVIRDTGIGIPTNEINLIFKKRFRGEHPVVQQNSGQGIGLYQCKNFVDLNRGSVKVESIVEEGTKFTLTFPRNLNQR